MSLTPKNQNPVQVPNTPTGESAANPAAPNSATTKAAVNPTAPNPATTKAAVNPAAPNLATSESPVAVAVAQTIVGTAENLFLYSEEFNNGSWSKAATGSASIPSVTTNAAIAPDGTMTAERVVFNTNGSAVGDRSLLRQNIALTEPSTISFWAKSNGSADTLGIHNGAVALSFTVTSDWKRYSFLTDENTSFEGLEARGDIDASVDIFIWGAQLNKGGLAPYVKTEATAKTGNLLDAPNSATSESVVNPSAPNLATTKALVNPSAPSVMTALAPAGVLRSVQPLFKFVDTLGLPDSVTYARSSSASYIETYKDPLGRFAKRLTNDYVGSVENLLFYSEDLLNARWGKVLATVVKDNNENLFKVIANQAGSNCYLLNPGLLSGNTYNSSIDVKAGTKNVSIRITATGSTGSLYFNPENGSIIENTIGEVSIRYKSNGVYRVSITNVQNSNGGLYLQVARGSGSSTVLEGDFFFASRSQSTLSTKALPYVKTLDSAVTQSFTASPRYEEKGLLVEGASTNLIQQSEDLTAGNWGKSNLTISSNQDLAPDGSFSADVLIPDNAQNLDVAHLSEFTSKAASALTYTLSAYVKAKEFNSISFLVSGAVVTDNVIGKININNKEVVSLTSSGDFDVNKASINILEVSNGYIRFGLSFETNADSALNVRLYVQDSSATTGDGSSGVYVWGAQLEQLPFATSYIRTEGSAVSRSADVINGNTNNFPDAYRPMTALSEFSMLGITTSSQTVWSYRKYGSILLYGSVSFAPNNPSIYYGPNRRGFSGVDSPLVTAILVSVYKADQTIDNYFNNDFVSSTVMDDVTVNNDSNLNIGSLDGGNALFGHIKRLEFYDLALTVNEVRKL